LLQAGKKGFHCMQGKMFSLRAGKKNLTFLSLELEAQLVFLGASR